MLILNRSIPYLATILVWLWLYLMTSFVTFWYIFVIILIISVLVLMLKLFNLQYRKKEFFAFLITTLFLVISSVLFLFFVDSFLIRQIAIVVISILIGYYYNNIFQFLYLPKSYQPYSLENISGYLNLLSLFLFFTGIFSVLIFFDPPFSLMIISSFVLTLVLTMQTFWVHKVDFSKVKLFLLVVSLIMAELFWAVHYLPSSFYVSGLLLAIIYYMLIVLGLNYFTSNLEKSNIKRTLLIGSTMIILLLTTAQWI